ncbi:hypothetical protein IC619_006100 [Hazenella sp. IB182353]|uniref:hypothetical protein n=1 Tax=Polycladospora coralii TaxID=2771432 RepID=UPI0017462A37|nr:hypothetical protein [Polycladospora coralii]MBS7530068.1 hypothetical protein [Polycladospora coralii]
MKKMKASSRNEVKVSVQITRRNGRIALITARRKPIPLSATVAQELSTVLAGGQSEMAMVELVQTQSGFERALLRLSTRTVNLSPTAAHELMKHLKPSFRNMPLMKNLLRRRR